MEMALSNSIEAKPEYQPTLRQRERAAALRRFNRWFVYLPIIFGALIVLIVVGLLFWVALIQPSENSRETVGGIASAVVILASIPMTLLCAIPSVLFIGITFQARKNGTAPIKRIQTLFWQLDSLILRFQSAVNETTPKVANLVIKGHAAVAYGRTLFNKLSNLLKRS